MMDWQVSSNQANVASDATTALNIETAKNSTQSLMILNNQNAKSLKFIDTIAKAARLQDHFGMQDQSSNNMHQQSTKNFAEYKKMMMMNEQLVQQQNSQEAYNFQGAKGVNNGQMISS